MSAPLSELEQQIQFKTYLLQAHNVRKHNQDTVGYLRRIYVKSRKTGDVWPELSAYRRSEKSGVTGPLIKKAFRSFALALQGNRCCYCFQMLPNIAHAKPIEHILPRNSYPQFSVHFWNLAVACFDCNQLKLKSNWGNFAVPWLEYPVATAFTEFYHPRFHRYGEHVRYDCNESNDACNVTYTGHTPQGKHLCSEMLYIVAARKNLNGNNPLLAEAIESIQQFEELHDLPALEAFRKSLTRRCNTN